MSWRAAPCLLAMQRDLDKAFPNRTRPDWILGDADHSSRVSDHNPDAKGMVHAIDIRLGGGLDVKKVLEACIGDARVWYVIHNRKIYSRTYGWVARAYTGANPHTTHIHVSVRYTPTAEADQSDWGFGGQKRRVRPLRVNLEDVREQFLRALDLRDGEVEPNVHVRRVQRALRTRGGQDIESDGYVGTKTLNAWGRWEGDDGEGRPRVPDETSLGRLVHPRWRLV